MQDRVSAQLEPPPPPPHKPPSKPEMAANFASSRDSASPAQKVQYFHDTKDKDQTKEASTDKENNKSLVHPNSKLEVIEKSEDLRSRITKQTNDIQYSCPICEAVLFSSHDFTIHLRSHNSLLVKDGVRSPPGMLDKGFICPECGKVLGSASSLDRHILVHSGERPYGCRICGLSFTTNGNMHRHMRTHAVSENGDYDSDASSDSPGSPKTLSPSSLVSLKRRRISRTTSEFNNNIVDTVLPVTSGTDYTMKRKTDSDDLHSNRKKKCDSRKSFIEKYDCQRCDKTGFPSANLLEIHIEEFHPECKAKCEPCNLVFKNHRVLNLHRYMVHHAEIKDNFSNSKQELVGFKDLTFVDFSSEKFPHIARIMCEQSLHHASSLHHRFQCDKCGRAFPCGSALNIHRQGCGTENYASSGESCHQDNDLSSSDNEMPTDLSSGGKRDSWGESKVSESSDDVEEERKRSSYFFACLDLQNKSLSNTPSQIQPPTKDKILKDSFFSYNNNNSEGKDLADIQSIISVTSSGGLLQDLSKSPQPTVLEVTPPDSGSRSGLFESGVTDEEQQDCFAAEFRKMKLRGEFPCRLCSSVFPNLRALKGHNRVHLSSNSGQSSLPYRCNMCPHFSTDKSALIRHMRTHNGDRPYECALCHYAFTTKANCERHLRNRHSKMTREDVKKSIIYHPSEDPTNEVEHKPCRDDVKRSLFGEKEMSKPFESNEHPQLENIQSVSKTFVEKSPLVLETLPLHTPVINRIHRISLTSDPNKNEHSQIKCSDVGTMTYEESDSVHTFQTFTDTPTKSDSDGDTPLDLSMDVLDLSKKKNNTQKENQEFDILARREVTVPQDLSIKSGVIENKNIYPLTVEALEKSESVQGLPNVKYSQEVNTSTTSPPGYDNQCPKSPNPEAIPKIDLTKLYPSTINPFFLNNNTPFTTFPAAAVTGPYPPYFIPPPAPILFSANPNQDLIEMKERLQKELIRGLQLTSGGSLVFDQISMVSAADRLQALQHQAMAEINWRMESNKEERKLYSPSINKEVNHSPTLEEEKEYPIQEQIQPKAAERNSQPKPKQDNSSSVKMVIKNGVLIPKQKQRRYRTERPFSCEHCSARFTLRSNMERHIKQQHPQFWTQRQRNGANIPTRRNTSLSSKMPQTLLSNGQFYPHSGISLYSAKSEDDISRSSSTNEHAASENKINVMNDFNKTCISEEVKNAIAQQLKTKFPTSDVSQNEEDNDDDLMDEEEDEDLVIDEEVKEDEPDEITPEKREKPEEFAIQKRYSMKDENQDLASVSRLLDNASTQTFRQYFHSDEDQPGEEGSEEDEEGLVAAGSTSEGCNSGSDENRSESENHSGANSTAVKKKSAYSLAPNRVSCPYCSRKFPWSSSLRRHVLTHTGQKPYKCSFCPLLFTTKSNCDRHLLRKHGGGTPAPCHDMQTTAHSETSANQSSANNYIMRNVPERPYKCKNCPSSTFSTLSNLKKHLSSKHHLSEKNEGAQSGYESQGSMSEEIDVGENEHCKNSTETEVKEKPVISDPREIHPSHFVDSVQFYKTHSLPVMLESNFVATPASTPASDLPFKCHLCEGSFAERQEALDHIRDNHCAEFQLLVSKGALEASASADDQQAQDEGGEEGLEQLRGKFPDYANRKVMCAFCLRRFWSAEDLRRHMRTHTGERPFSCDICRRRFTLKHSMLRHRKKHSFPATEETSPVSDDDTNVPPASTNHNNNVVASAKPWMKARLEEESDLISNLLGIQDKSIVDKMLLSKSADDAAKLLGVKK